MMELVVYTINIGIFVLPFQLSECERTLQFWKVQQVFSLLAENVLSLKKKKLIQILHLETITLHYIQYLLLSLGML